MIQYDQSCGCERTSQNSPRIEKLREKVKVIPCKSNFKQYALTLHKRRKKQTEKSIQQTENSFSSKQMKQC